MSDSPRSVPDWLERLITDARFTDGAPPFSDQALVDYRTAERELVVIGEDAAALVTATEAEFVVDPAARGHGIGTRLLETLLAAGATLFWAHGDAPAARALAASHGLTAVRELLHLSGPVQPENPLPETTRLGSGIDVFRVGTDEDEWIALNAKTFASHPEQGSVTRADLEQLETENWFDADNFLVLRRDGRMIGYCWLKVEGGSGEFYVVGVDPDHHGEHLGSLLFDAGLARLAELGIREAHLYVEADNEPALRLYRARGFSQDSIDVQYSAVLSRRTIRVFPDFGHEWPLWEGDDDKYAMEPADYALSPALTGKLRAWYDEWERSLKLDPSPRWDGSRSEVEWQQDGAAIAAMLRHEVGSFADVAYMGEIY